MIIIFKFNRLVEIKQYFYKTFLLQLEKFFNFYVYCVDNPITKEPKKQIARNTLKNR